MTFELSIPLKGGRLEIEFDDADDLEGKLRALDLRRIERAVAAARRGPGPARKKAAKKKAARA